MKSQRQNKSQLGKTLKMPRSKIQKHLKKLGAPQPDAHGLYDLAAVRRWVADERSRNDVTPLSVEMMKARLEKLQAQCVLLQREIGQKGEVVPKADTSAFLSELGRETQTRLRGVAEAVAGIYQQLWSLDNARAYALRDSIREKLAEASNGLAGWIHANGYYQDVTPENSEATEAPT